MVWQYALADASSVERVRTAASFSLTFERRPLGFSLGQFEEPNSASQAIRLFINHVS